MKVLTTKGEIDLDALEVRDVVEVCENTRKVLSQFWLDGELVRQDVAVSMLCPPRINAIAGNLNG